MAIPKLDFASIIRLVLLFICFIMSCVGTARPQYQNGDVKYYLWKVKNGPWSLNFNDIDCGAFKNKMRAAYAFAIMADIALAFALLGVVVIVVSYCVAQLKQFVRMLRIITTVLSIVAFVFLLIAWSISASGRTQKYCGSNASLADQGFGITEGLGLLIASWVLMLFDMILGIIGLIMNRGNPDETKSAGTL